MSTLIIVPCGRAKIWDRHPDAGPVPAADAYVGTLFKVNRAYAECFSDRWMILSAKYGFIEPTFVIPGPYDVSFKRREPRPISLDQLRTQAHAKNLWSAAEVIGLGGRDYRAVLEQVFPAVRFPFGGLDLYEMVSETKQAVLRAQR